MVEKSLTLDFLRTAEAAALAAARWMGHGDNDAADHAAVEAMRQALDDVRVSGTVVIAKASGIEPRCSLLAKRWAARRTGGRRGGRPG